MYSKVCVGMGDARMDWVCAWIRALDVCVCTCAIRNGDAAGATWGLKAPARAQPQSSGKRGRSQGKVENREE